MYVILCQGDSLEVTIEGSDGEFRIEYGDQRLSITSDLPDSLGRGGVVYDEVFSPFGAGVDVNMSTDMDALVQAAKDKALQNISDDSVMLLYNLFEAEAQRRGLMGV